MENIFTSPKIIMPRINKSLAILREPNGQSHETNTSDVFQLLSISTVKQLRIGINMYATGKHMLKVSI